MLEGLEVSVLMLSETLQNKDFRIDSAFWTQQPKLNNKLRYDQIGNCLNHAQYGISIAMKEGNLGFPIYRMNEIHNMLCDFEVDKYAIITKDELNTFKLNNGDVLFNRTNSFEWVGRTGVFYKTEDRDFIFASYLVRFVPDQDKILPEYLTAFLNSKMGIYDIKRRARQSINQTNVNPEEVKQIQIPLLDFSLQKQIQMCFVLATDKLKTSKSLYTQAENLLLETLGLQNFKPSSEAVNIKSFKDSFGTSGRLDAEYYQLKYEDYKKAISTYKNGYQLLEDICDIKDENFTPNHNQIYAYIELSNIDKVGGITGATIENGSELPTRARRLITTNDVLISSIEGSLSSCALVPEKYNGALCSTGFYVIQSQQLNSETLLVLMKSTLMQTLLKQGCSGTILTAINNEAFKSLPIPIVEINAQQQIAALIQENFRLKAESERLLDLAKRAVEMAIEHDETVAIDFINEQIKEQA